MIDLSSPAAHVRFTGILSHCLSTAGVDDPDARATLAVGLADFLVAAREVERELEAALLLDPTIPTEADEALTHICAIPGWLFTEARDHAGDLHLIWDTHLVAPLSERGFPGNEASQAQTGRASS